jgi:small nuclear ribonucleoprotein (snRNP)-like protein
MPPVRGLLLVMRRRPVTARLRPKSHPVSLPPRLQIFLTFFKTLEGKTVTVELKNDLQVRGTLMSVDQYLNLKLGQVEVVEKEKFPQLVSARTALPPRAMLVGRARASARAGMWLAHRRRAPGWACCRSAPTSRD